MATMLVGAAPAQAEEIYPRPWDNTVTLAGHGFGHGHGMSQYGAYGAALKGLTWQQIVDFYYPGTVRTQIGNPLIRVDVTGELSRTAVVKAESRLRATFGLASANPLDLPLAESSGKQIVRYAVVRAPLVRGTKTAALLRYRLADGTWKTYRTEPSGRVNISRVPLSTDPTSNQLHVYNPSGSVLTYRAVLRATLIGASGKELLVPIMALPMETYLRGVVPNESISSWPQAALSAQAVAARSYAKYAMDHPRGPGYYDTCDTTSCQVFKGMATEPTSTNAAIKASVGIALYSEGAAAFTEFSPSNGGWSAAVSGKPYLIAQADPYDGVAANPNHTWSASISVATIEAKWPSIGSYRRLRIIYRDGHGEWGGRVLNAAIVGSAGTVNITGTEFRTAFGLRSEWFIPTNLRSAPSYPRDLSGDHKADVLGVVARTGYLRMYPGNGASGWKPMSVIGTGFGGFSKVFTAGTWDVDALSDVMAQKADGSLWLYPGTASGPLGPPRQVGSGWGVYNAVFPAGDFGGDGLSDLMARRADGTLMLHSGNGSGGFLRTQQVGSGWGSFTSVFSPGDFSGDRNSDVIARTSAGLLYLYPGNGSGGWLSRRLIGSGWNAFSTIISSGDFSGDGRSDLLARGRDGTLWMYPGNGASGFLPRRLVGSGWNIFSTVLP